MQLLNCCGCETNGGIIVLLFLASELWLRENIWEFSALLPECFAGGEHDAVSSMESTRLSKQREEKQIGPLVPDNGSRRQVVPSSRSINFRKLID